MEVVSKKEARDLGLKKYFTGKMCKHGHVSHRYVSNGHCIKCTEKSNSEYRKENKELIVNYKRKYNKENRKKVSEYQKEYAGKNRESLKEYGLNYRNVNKDKLSKQKRDYYKNNKDRILKYSKDNRDKINKRRSEWVKNNPMQHFARCSIRRIELAVGKDRVTRAELELGYTQQEFISHIESKFKDGMSWDNRSEWHIDHIKPLKAFIDEGVEDLSVINALDNLQPLWPSENWAKSDKF